MFIALTLRQPQRGDIGAWIERALILAQRRRRHVPSSSG